MKTPTVGILAAGYSAIMPSYSKMWMSGIKPDMTRMGPHCGVLAATA
jgi:hypothetical protein